MTIHICPTRDVAPHDLDSPGECACGPRVDWIDPTTELPYANGPLVVHELRATGPFQTQWAVVADAA